MENRIVPKSIERIVELIESQANILTTTGTGGGTFDDFEATYKKQDRELRSALNSLGMRPPFPWRSLWEWHGYYKQNLPTYAERRTCILDLRNKAEDQLENLATSSGVSSPEPSFTSAVVRLSLQEAERQIGQGHPLSAVDRVHTAIHGHLRLLCGEEGITFANDASVTALMKLLRKYHPALATSSPYGGEIGRVLNAMSSILNELNTIRNNGSMAHPNENLLGEAEAMLAVNAGRTILGYLDAKLSAPAAEPFTN